MSPAGLWTEQPPVERGVLGSQSREPDDGRDDGRLVELPSHSFAVLNILECSFVNYIMSHPLLHSAISSSPVIAGFNYGLRDTNLPCVRLRASSKRPPRPKPKAQTQGQWAASQSGPEGHTTGSKMRIRPSSFGLCAVPRTSRSRLCLAGLSAYAKRFFPGRASCGPFSKILM